MRTRCQVPGITFLKIVVIPCYNILAILLTMYSIIDQVTIDSYGWDHNGMTVLTWHRLIWHSLSISRQLELNPNMGDSPHSSNGLHNQQSQRIIHSHLISRCESILRWFKEFWFAWIGSDKDTLDSSNSNSISSWNGLAWLALPPSVMTNGSALILNSWRDTETTN